MIKPILYFLFLSLLCSCTKSKHIAIEGYENLEIVISAEKGYDPVCESFYFELRSASGSEVVNKTWFACRGFNEIEWSDFSGKSIDSLIYLKFSKAELPDDSIIMAYDLRLHRKLEREEIEKIFSTGVN